MTLKYKASGNYFQVSEQELPVYEMYDKHLVFLLVLLVSSQARRRSRTRRRKTSFDFNCRSECGKYNKRDYRGESLHRRCNAMEKSDKCQQKFSIKNKMEVKEGGNKGRNKGSNKGMGGIKMWVNGRIIGRLQTKKPMPWMTLISVKGSQCGGTLINNQFVLTAASCFCSAAMLCKRMVMDVEKNVPNKIRVS